MLSSSKPTTGRKKVLDYDKDRDLIYLYNYPLQVQKAIQEVQGVAGMIVYDGEVSDEEVTFLSQWLQRHEGLMTKYPLKELNAIFVDISKDGIVTAGERKKLFQFLSSIAAGSKSDPVIDGIFSNNPEIAFKERTFILTGEMEFGPREKAEEEIRKSGGVVSGSCTLRTDYLVVGKLGSEAYKYSRFGRKIEKALHMRHKKKSVIQIVRERDFVSAVLRPSTA